MEGIINNEIKRYVVLGELVPLAETIIYLKGKGIRIDKNTLIQRCEHLNAKYI